MRFIPSTEGPQVAEREPVSVRDFDAHQERAQAEKLDNARHDAIAFSTIAREPAELLHEPGSVTAGPYESITYDQWLVAFHCRGIDLEGNTQRFVLWFEPDEAEQFHRGLGVVITHTRNLQAEKAEQ